MALENLTPAVRVEAILNGEDIQPATRLEYFLQKAATCGGSETEPLIVDLTDATNTLMTQPEAGGLDYRTTVDLTDAVAAFGTRPVFVMFNGVIYDGDTSQYVIDATRALFSLVNGVSEGSLIVTSYILDNDEAAVLCNYFIYTFTP